MVNPNPVNQMTTNPLLNSINYSLRLWAMDKRSRQWWFYVTMLTTIKETGENM